MIGKHDTCVSRVPVFATLTRQQQEVVAGYARHTHLRRTEQLYRQGDAVSRLFVVHTGRVKILHTNAEGRERLIRVAGPGDVVGEHAFITGQRPDNFVVAMDDTQVCVFDHRDLAALVTEYPAIALQMLKTVTARLDALEHRVTALSGSDVTARLADYLSSLPIAPETLGARDGHTRIRLPLAKKDIASYLGTTPESVSRALRRLHDLGSISVGPGSLVVIRDADALERLSRAQV